MSKQTNAEYYAGRAVIERGLIESATDERAAAIHAELAARYEELALQPPAPMEGSPPDLAPVLEMAAADAEPGAANVRQQRR